MNFEGTIFDIKTFADFLVKTESFKTGKFTLKSGVVSPYYIDLRPAICNTKMRKMISLYIYNLYIRNYVGSTTAICGVPYSGIPIAASCCERNPSSSSINMLVLRKERKQHGTGRMIEGLNKSIKEVVLIEDVISTGGSLLESIQELEIVGLKVRKIFVVVDREMGGIDMLKSKGYDVEAITTVTELMFQMISNPKSDVDPTMLANVIEFNRYSAQLTAPILPLSKMHSSAIAGDKLLELMKLKSSNLCLSADVDTVDRLLEVAEMCGDYIVVLKTHIDALEGVTEKHIAALRNCADRKQFLLFEDRKLSDIGSTMKKQLKQIAGWADIVTVHGLSGEAGLEALKEFKDIGILMIGEMSCAGNLIDYRYTNQCVEMMSHQSLLMPDQILGFVSQRAISGNKFFHFTPGVRIGVEGDGMGQKYRTPEEACKSGADIIIVGRGILEADDVVKECMKYRDEGWKGIMAREEKALVQMNSELTQMNNNLGTATITQLQNDLTYLQQTQKKVSDQLTKLYSASGVSDPSSMAEQAEKVASLTDAMNAINDQTSDTISQLKGMIANSHTTTDAQNKMLENVGGNIQDKQQRAEQQALTIEQKADLIRTRNRMLELSIEKNIYKRKVIYTILALILAVLVLMVAGYVTFNRRA